MITLIHPDTGELIHLRAPHNYDTDAASLETGIRCEGPGAQQQFAEEADINTIVRRFGLTGELPTAQRTPLEEVDFTGITDYTTAMLAVTQAREVFYDQPAHIRARFDNDPQRMIAFFEDASNRKEAEDLGLIVKPPEKTRDAVTAIDELAASLKTTGAAGA